MNARKNGNNTVREDSAHRSVSSRSMSSRVGTISNAADRKRGMILPFEPLSITFDDIHYAVDMPQVLLIELHIII